MTTKALTYRLIKLILFISIIVLIITSCKLFKSEDDGDDTEIVGCTEIKYNGYIYGVYIECGSVTSTYFCGDGYDKADVTAYSLELEEYEWFHIVARRGCIVSAEHIERD